MNSRLVIWLLATVFLAANAPARAQQPATVPRIGYLTAGFPVGSVRNEAFRQGLRELGYVEGKNIVIEYRYAEGKFDRLPALAADLVRLKVELIVTAGGASTRPAKEATATIPIVMTQDPDPVGSGFVISLARPGGNITGLSTLAPEISGKQLELLKETIPKLSRLAAFGTSTYPGNGQSLKEVELAAKAFGVELQHLDVLSPKNIATAFRAAVKGRADAVHWLVAGGVALAHRTEIVDLAVNSRLPVMYDKSDFVEDGGLIAYGVNYNDLARRDAMYVDRILNGAKPADLPVERPVKFEFISNLRAAKQIGLSIPESILFRADKVIK